jgi:DHA1 family inner membrane transport protein
MQSAPFAIATIFLLGFAVFGTVPALQMQIMAAAEGAPNLASALNIAAFNLGNAAGAWLGGLLISAGYTFSGRGSKPGNTFSVIPSLPRPR